MGRIKQMAAECVVLLGLLICASPIEAQTVQQSGSVTQNHIATWATNGVIKDGGAVAANQSLMGGSATTTTAGNTVYCASAGCGATVATASQVPFTGTLSNLNASVATAPGLGHTVTVTVYTGTFGAATASTLTCTISGTATSCTDATHQVNLPIGTSWTIQFTVGASATATAGQSGGVQFTSSSPATPTTPFVLQSGQITSGHQAVWTTNGVIQDGGVPVTSAVAPGPFVSGDVVCVNNLLQLATCGPASGQTPQAPTAPIGTDSTQIATTDFVQKAITQVLNTSGVNPGGRITTSSGVCTPSTDIVAATTVYYAPCNGNMVPIYNGTTMLLYQFTANAADTVGLSLALGSNWAALQIFDLFATLVSGAPALCTSPQWSNNGAGSSARGFSLALYNGILTNAATLTCRNSNSTTVSVAANQATYLGTFVTNSNAGQIDLKFGTAASGGGTARLGIWNMYNQILAAPKVSDTTASFTTSSPGSWVPMMNNSGNSIIFVTGLAQQSFLVNAFGFATTGANLTDGAKIGCSLNSPSPSNPDFQAGIFTPVAATQSTDINVPCAYPPAFGFNAVYSVIRAEAHNATYQGNVPYAQNIGGQFWW